MKTILLIFLTLATFSAVAQNCDYFPADCPDGIEDARDSMVCINNFILPQEIRMQDNIRNAITALLNETSHQTGWSFYEFFEESENGIKSGNTPLAYSLRRPHEYRLGFVFIVNNDSIKAWQHWYNNDLRDAIGNVVNSYRSATEHPSAAAVNYADSANYYGALKTKYFTDHAADYQKAIVSGDKKAQQSFENASKRFDDKINGFIAKSSSATETQLAHSTVSADAMQSYKREHTIRYRNASTIRISFDINSYLVAADDEDKKVTKQLAIPGSALAIALHNGNTVENEVYGQFLRSPDFAIALFGQWNTKKTRDGYQATYFADRKNTDNVSEKKIPCDRIQTIALHVEGSNQYINEFFRAFNSAKLSGLTQ